MQIDDVINGLRANRNTRLDLFLVPFHYGTRPSVYTLRLWVNGKLVMTRDLNAHPVGENWCTVDITPALRRAQPLRLRLQVFHIPGPKRVEAALFLGPLQVRQGNSPEPNERKQ